MLDIAPTLPKRVCACTHLDSDLEGKLSGMLDDMLDVKLNEEPDDKPSHRRPGSMILRASN